MKKRTVIHLLAVLMLVGCDQQESDIYTGPPVDKAKMMTQVLSVIDGQYPGRGLADYASNSAEDVPKSYAMILLGAQAEAASRSPERLSDLGVKAGYWLLQNSDANNDGVIGWGVPVAWDAYGDGSINPVNTEYTISTAIVIDALLGWLGFANETEKARILDVVEAALYPYLPDTMRTPAGLLPYSLLSHDRNYDTFNSAVYLAGQMQRFSQFTTNSELRGRLKSAADATMIALIRHKKKAPETGHWYWDYSIQENNPNDLPHAGYIIEGILTYIQNRGRYASKFDDKDVLGHLKDFLNSDGSVRGWPNFRPEILTPPRLYGLSIAAQLSCRFKGQEYGNIFLAPVESYESQSSRKGYLKYPNNVPNNKQVAEYESYLYRALMSCGIDDVKQQ